MKSPNTFSRTLPALKLSFWFVLLLLVSGRALAQGTCVTQNSIAINTGYDPVSGTTITPVGNDPEWSITAMSPDCAAICACSPTYNAFTVTPLVYPGHTWATNPNSEWISFINTGGFAISSTGVYNVTFTRTFKLCTADSIDLDIDIANDNYIADINFDGSGTIFSQPATFPASNYTMFTHINRRVFLTAGTHTLNVTVVQQSVTKSLDYFGLNIVGNLVSATGAASLVGPASPPQCSCSASPCVTQNAIAINSGYDPVSGTTITPVGNDPEWSITAMSPDCAAICACSPTYNAFTVTPLVYPGHTWATNPNSEWISFINTGGFAISSTGVYNVTFTRTFRLCTADSIDLDIDLANDNYVANMNFDGSAVIFSQPPTFPASNYTMFTHINRRVFLTAGTHTLNVTVVQQSVTKSLDYFGLNIVGNLVSATGTPSLVGPASPPQCSCSAGMPCDATVTLSAVFSHNTGNPDYNCVFTSNANATPGSGWTPVSYDYTLNGLPYTSSLGGGFTDVQSITTPNGSGGVILEVTVTFVNAFGDTCIKTATRILDCNGGNGFVRKDGSTGINDVSSGKDAFTVYPNPAAENVTISSDVSLISKIDIINIVGERVASYSFNNINKATIIIKGLPAGTYIFKINNNTSVLVNKSE